MTTTKTLNRLQAAKKVAREKYAWPGGYALFCVTSDGACLCPACVRAEWRSVCYETMHRLSGGWQIAGADHAGNSDETETCDHCGEEIT